MKIVAEIGINANGDLAIARQLIFMARKAGADYVKFQKRTVEKVYSKICLESARESPWGATQRAQKEALEFGHNDYGRINEICLTAGIRWFASCWDLDSLALIESFDPPLHKISSPMLDNQEFLKAVAGLGRKTLISTGMSDLQAVIRAVEIFEVNKCPYVLLHCVSEYPCPDERINLAGMLRLREQFGIPRGLFCEGVGYSNHSPGIEACVGAAYLGAQWIEVHITLDRSMYGSDQAASLERRGLELVCKYCRNAETIMGDGRKIITKAEQVNAAKLRYWKNG